MGKAWIKPNGRVRYLSELDSAFVLQDCPLWFHLCGLSQTASGYGRRLTSLWKVRFVVAGRSHRRRVYVTQYSNAGTPWINFRGDLYVVDSNRSAS